MVDGLKSLVAGVRVRANRQDVYVPVPYPRNLIQTRKTIRRIALLRRVDIITTYTAESIGRKRSHGAVLRLGTPAVD